MNAQFLLAAGSAGVEAATNIVVEQANRTMLLYVYAAVIALCFVTFRSWRAVVVAVVPLALTSILCEALMVALGIGVKVATLPVIALGVGIGVDYALYLLSVQLAQQRAGVPLGRAYKRAVQFTGKVVALVGVTLAAGVITWAFSPIKFQADMGILLTFMFLWNMVGALVLIPALSHFLLPTSVFRKRRGCAARQAIVPLTSAAGRSPRGRPGFPPCVRRRAVAPQGHANPRPPGEFHEPPFHRAHVVGVRRVAFDRQILAAASPPRPRRRSSTRDRLRYTYATLAERVRPPRIALAALGVEPGRNGRHHGLGQPSLPRVLLRGADDGRRPAHGERAHLARSRSSTRSITPRTT